MPQAHRLTRNPVRGLAWLVLAAGLAWTALACPARAAEPLPKAETYLCPNVAGLGVDCFLDAVQHLYTMCRQVKSIEILEFGYDHAEEGVNGAKSEYCIDKHKATIMKPLQAALREASGSRAALDALRGLHEVWLGALQQLRWKPPETDDEYKGRVGHMYDVFRERAAMIRTTLAEARTAKSVRHARLAPANATTAGAKTANAGH